MKSHRIGIAIVLLLAGAVGAFASGDAELGGGDDVDWNRTGYPIVNEPFTISIATARSGNVTLPYEELEYYRIYEEMTGITVEWNVSPGEGWQERKSLMLATNDLPDMFYGGVLTDEELARYGSRGVFLALQDYIPEFVPRLEEVFEQRPDLEAASTFPDGNLYGLPGLRVRPDSLAAGNLFINATWLETLGLDVPRTTEDFIDVLRAFKQDDPNGNGQSDEIPLSFQYGNDTWGATSAIFGAFGIISYSDNLFVRGDEVSFVPATDEYREGVEYLRSLASENLLDPESYTHSNQVFKAKGSERILGSMPGHAVYSFTGSVHDEDPDYQRLAPLTGPQGDQLWGRGETTQISRSGAVITNANEHPEISLRWADFSYDRDMSLQARFGIYDYNLARLDDGRLQEISPSVKPFQRPFAQSLFVILEEDDIRVPDARGQERLDKVEFYRPYLVEQGFFPNVVPTIEEAQTIARIQPDLFSYVDQMQAKWVLQGGLEDDWEDYLEELEKIGLSEYMEVMQARLDRAN